MSKPIYVGVDQSYTETVITLLTSPTNYKSHSIKGEGETTLKKMHSIYLRIASILLSMDSPRPKHLFIEGGSYKSTGRIFSLGQLSGAIISIAIDGGIPYTEVAPTTLKKFITGRGQCSKQFVMDSIQERFGQKFTNDNYADSYGLALMAYYHYNYDKMPNKNRPSKETVYSLTRPCKKKPAIRYRRSKKDF